MVTGQAGIGKSCLLRRVKSQAMRLGRMCVDIDATGIDANEFTIQLANHLRADCDSQSSMAQHWKAIHERVTAETLVGRPIVILVDHFDLVEFGCSQVIRRLLHLADITGAPITVLLAARECFTAPLLLDAVELSMELLPWSEEEVQHFITQQIRAAGCTTPIFSQDATRGVHFTTNGIPASVAWLCDICLLAAMSHGLKHVDAELVDAAAAELSARSPLSALPGSSRRTVSTPA
jgi:type II secretory pathway predicted ATPase ExeA